MARLATHFRLGASAQYGAGRLAINTCISEPWSWLLRLEGSQQRAQAPLDALGHGACREGRTRKNYGPETRRSQACQRLLQAFMPWATQASLLPGAHAHSTHLRSDKNAGSAPLPLPPHPGCRQAAAPLPGPWLSCCPAHGPPPEMGVNRWVPRARRVGGVLGRAAGYHAGGALT
jgi:hypothetical protein